MATTESSPAHLPETLILHCGHLIDGTGNPPRERVSLIVRGGSVGEIVPTASLKAEAIPGASAIDATDATVLPGLMDIHVHLASVVDPDEPHALLAMMAASSPLTTLHAAKNARLLLEAGFTTLRDVAGYTNLRNAEVEQYLEPAANRRLQWR